MSAPLEVVLKQYSSADYGELYKIATLTSTIDTQWKNEWDVNQELVIEFATANNTNYIMKNADTQCEGNVDKPQETEQKERKKKIYPLHSKSILPSYKSASSSINNTLTPFKVTKIDYETDTIYVLYLDDSKEVPMKYSDVLTLNPKILVDYYRNMK